MSQISVRIDERVIDRWTDYSIDCDMLSPADAFNMTLAPAIKEVWDIVAPDSAIEVRVDDTPIITGYIDDRTFEIQKQGPAITISGRDKVGRMVDESAPLGAFGAQDLKALAENLSAPQFTAVVLSNARNRDLVRGRRSGKAPSGSEPVFSKKAKAPKKVEPGETRWDVLQQFLEPARLLAWSTGDGRELVVGQPNYSQGVQYRFFVPEYDSTRKDEGNVLSASVTTTVSNRFSQIRVTGSGRGDSENYGPRVNKHTHTVTQPDRPVDGFHAPADFIERKQLIMSDPDVKSADDAKERAERELALRDAERLVLELEVKGHNQKRFRNDAPALFAFDTLADVEIQPIGLSGVFLITAVRFSVSKTEGEVARLRLVPKGTELVT